jgi:adenylate cyclase class 2
MEHEVEINDPEEMKSIIKLVGFEELSYVNKTRQKCKYNGLEICFDEIDELGSYIEVEKLGDDSDGPKIQTELFEFLKSLGIKDEDRATTGYDVLIAQKNGKL